MHIFCLSSSDCFSLSRGGANINCYGDKPTKQTQGVQGAEPLGGGQGAKPPEADAFLVLKS